jgi:hypothetical protein
MLLTSQGIIGAFGDWVAACVSSWKEKLKSFAEGGHRLGVGSGGQVADATKAKAGLADSWLIAATAGGAQAYGWTHA